MSCFEWFCGLFGVGRAGKQEYGTAVGPDNRRVGQRELDSYANQCNPNNKSYQGYSSGYRGTGTKEGLDNHANQMNPNNKAYRSSRG
mmetsp:Transcript_64430/g.163292  ORF Transcript_64430/g.163292 Transcript_64430/m.163292 type:complete len:87 (+) Transcript_64430:96-356(+)